MRRRHHRTASPSHASDASTAAGAAVAAAAGAVSDSPSPAEPLAAGQLPPTSAAAAAPGAYPFCSGAGCCAVEGGRPLARASEPPVPLAMGPSAVSLVASRATLS